VQHAERQLGGLTAIALVAAARLGAQTAFAGVLGRDELSDYCVGELKREQVNLNSLLRRADFPPVHSFIVVDAKTGTRNVFSHRAVEYKLPANWPPRELILSTRVLFLDHSALPAMVRAARIARVAGIPILADLERDSGPQFKELIELVDHLIVSEAFALRYTKAKTAQRALKRLWHSNRSTAVITLGERGCVFIDREDPGKIQAQPALRIKAVDTTGCGDVFHGAYAAALASDMAVHERIRFASAAAALKTRKLGAQAGIPTRSQLNAFLTECGR
jgi:ribokinase